MRVNMSEPISLLVMLLAGLAAVLLVGCASPSGTAPQITSTSFGSANGTPVEIYTLKNAKGAEARICTYGGALVSLKVPDRNGEMADVVLGFDKAEDYVAFPRFFGVIVGRYGNRIAKGTFKLNGVTYNLAINNGPNALHGGIKGFDKVVWQAKTLATSSGPALELTYLSKDGEEGYPGNLKTTAIYTLKADNTLQLEITATTDKDTVLNLTGHSYFNLAGKGDVLSHEMYINADKFVVADSNSIPTGEFRPVEGTPFDFRKPTTIGARINDDYEQLKFGAGYDHCYVVNKGMGRLGLMARVSESTSGRVMEVWSTEPGVQFYTGNFLDGSARGKGGVSYARRTGFCLEPQHYPDSPNHPDWPSVVLKPGQTYSHTIQYRFSTK